MDNEYHHLDDDDNFDLTCPQCGGCAATWDAPGKHQEECDVCNGEGQITRHDYDQYLGSYWN